MFSHRSQYRVSALLLSHRVAQLVDAQSKRFYVRGELQSQYIDMNSLASARSQCTLTRTRSPASTA